MDISTGHMVLSYMEDHLKNKQRLEQEWVSLCGYEAEPCATTVAFKASFGRRQLTATNYTLSAQIYRGRGLVLGSMKVMGARFIAKLQPNVSKRLVRLSLFLAGGEQEEEPLPRQTALRPQSRHPQRGGQRLRLGLHQRLHRGKKQIT